MVRGAVCFNTQPPEGGCACPALKAGAWMGFNTQPPEGGCPSSTAAPAGHCGFQHTAARRRLPTGLIDRISTVDVSTHSRPKAAAWFRAALRSPLAFQHTAARRRLPRSRQSPFAKPCFNTQPPEGGCGICRHHGAEIASFNTQPPEGGCGKRGTFLRYGRWFQHTAARRRLRHASRANRRAGCFNTQPPEGGCPC